MFLRASVSSRRLLPAFLCFLITLTPGLNGIVGGALIAPAQAETTGFHAPVAAPRTAGYRPGASGPGLDLSSTSPTILVHPGTVSGTINLNVGGNVLPVSAGSFLTPAEFVALQGILANGTQTLALGAQGQAVGGSFVLDARRQNLSGLVIPADVTAIARSTGTPLVITGKLIDNGNLFGVSLTRGFTIRASQIDVNAGGVLSTILPSSLQSLFASNPNLNLSLISLGDINNSGTISSRGVLSLIAGGNINNISPAGGSAVMTGDRGVSLFSHAGNIVNSGIISSATSNITFNTVAASDLVLNNLNGQVLANAGSINFRLPNFEAKRTTELLNGLLSANSINFNAGNGLLDVNAGQINGTVNVTAGIAHVTVQNGDLTVGKNVVSGDPTYINETGNILLTANLIFPGQALAILAAGDVLANNTVKLINLSSSTKSGGTLYILAGATFASTGDPPVVPPSNPDTSNTYTVTGFNATGNSISLPFVSINTSSTAAGKDGGGVTLATANQTTGTNGNIAIGAIKTSSASHDAGNIMILGKNISTLGGIEARSGNPQIESSAERIHIGSETATTSGSQISFTDGAASGGTIGPNAVINGGTISIGDQVKNNGLINATGVKNGGDINIISDGSVNISNSIMTGGVDHAGALQLRSQTGDIVVNGQINTTSSNLAGDLTVVGNGGNVEIAKGINASGINRAGSIDVEGGNLVNIGFNLQSVNPLALTAQAGITGTSPNGIGSNVFITCANGDIRIGRGINTASGNNNNGVLLSASNNGLVRVDGGITATSRNSYSAGVTVSSGGDELTGIEIKGPINTSSGTSGGPVGLNSTGEIFLGNSINTSGKSGQAGFVVIQSGFDTNVKGSILMNGKTGGSVGTNGLVLTSTQGIVNVTGSLSTSTNSRPMGAAQFITITAGDGIRIGGSILAQGVTGQPVTLDTDNGAIIVGGSINTSALTVSNTAAGAGGDIKMGQSFPGLGPSYTFIGGSLNSSGGNSTGAQASLGGNAGNIFMRGAVLPSGADLGSVIIGGSVIAKGGNTGPASTGGTGGAVSIHGATVQIKGALGGISVNASQGLGGTGGAGSIVIKTFGIQPLTTDFNLISQKPDQYVLPGALFVVGNASVNGTRGSLVAGSNGTVASGIGILFGSGPSGPSITGITINTNGGTANETDSTSIQLGTSGTTTTPTFSVINNIGTFTPGVVPAAQLTARMLATPGESLALFEKTRTGTQTIGLTATGAIDMNLASGVAGNKITIGGEEFGRPLSAFNLSTAITGHESQITMTINQTDANTTTYIDVPMSKILPNIINGALLFSDLDGTNNASPTPKWSRIEFGRTLTVGSAGSIGVLEFGNANPDTITLDLRGSSSLATLNNNHSISGSNVLVRNESGALTVNLGALSTIGAATASLTDSRLEFSAAQGTTLTSPLTIKSGLLGSNAQFFNTHVSLFGSSITVGVFNPTTFETHGPVLNNSAFVRTESKTSTVIASDGDLFFGGSPVPSAFIAGTTFSATEMKNLNTDNAAFFAGGALKLYTTNFTSGPTVGNFNIYDTNLTGNSVLVDVGTLADAAGSLCVFTSTRDMTIHGNDDILMNAGTTNAHSGGNMFYLSSQGTVQIAGNYSAGTASTSGPESTTLLQGLLHSYVKLPGQIGIFGPSGVNIAAGSSLSSLGGSCFVQAGNDATIAVNAVIGNNVTLNANGGNLSITATGNVNGGSTDSFNARAFTNGGGVGGIEAVAGTAETFIAFNMAHRPATLLYKPPALPTTVTVHDLKVPPPSKGLIDMTGETTANLTGTINVYILNSEVLCGSNDGGTHTVNLNNATFTAISPVSSTKIEASDEVVVDTAEDAEDNALAVKL